MDLTSFVVVQSDDNCDCGSASFELTAALITVFGTDTLIISRKQKKKQNAKKTVMVENKKKFSSAVITNPFIIEPT